VDRYHRNYYYDHLSLAGIFGKHKGRGRDAGSLIKALLSYKLTENQSVTKAADWINRGEVLNTFELESFEQRTIYRVLEIIGENREGIIADIQEALFKTYDFKHTDINMDWTSFVLYGDKCPLGKYGYSRDHQPYQEADNAWYQRARWAHQRSDRHDRS